MTTINRISIACAICGDSSEHTCIMSTNSFGSPDLDLRPPPMKRGTITYWLQQCPNCGFVSDSLDEADEEERELWRSGAFQMEREEIIDPGLIGMFRTRALMDERLGRAGSAGHNALCAAWAADDQDGADPILLRSRAADLLMDAIVQLDPSDAVQARTQLVDILRRAHRWREAVTVADDVLRVSDINDVLRQVAQFGKACAERQDDACYTVADAVPGAGG